MNESVYVISSTDRPGEYKIGKHTGCSTKLITRYRTYLKGVSLKILYPCSNASDVEKYVHKALKQYIIPHEGGSLSEWFKCMLSDIETIFDELPRVEALKQSPSLDKEETESDCISVILKQEHILTLDKEDSDLLNQKWYLDPEGRARIFQTDSSYLHRIVMERIQPIPKGHLVIHKNGNRLDNRRSNLVLTTQVELQKGRAMQYNNTSGVRGVSYDKSRDRWIAYIMVNKKKMQKYFKTKEAAVLWRQHQETLLYS